MLVTVFFVPAAGGAPDDAVTAVLPVAVGYAAVQLAVAAHVVVVRLRGHGRAPARGH